MISARYRQIGARTDAFQQTVPKYINARDKDHGFLKE